MIFLSNIIGAEIKKENLIRNRHSSIRLTTKFHVIQRPVCIVRQLHTQVNYDFFFILHLHLYKKYHVLMVFDAPEDEVLFCVVAKIRYFKYRNSKNIHRI